MILYGEYRAKHDLPPSPFPFLCNTPPPPHLASVASVSNLVIMQKIKPELRKIEFLPFALTNSHGKGFLCRLIPHPFPLLGRTLSHNLFGSSSLNYTSDLLDSFCKVWHWRSPRWVTKGSGEHKSRITRPVWRVRFSYTQYLFKMNITFYFLLENNLHCQGSKFTFVSSCALGNHKTWFGCPWDNLVVH